MHWEKYIELTFDSKGDFRCITDKVHIGMPMPMPSFPSGSFHVNKIKAHIINRNTLKICVLLIINQRKLLEQDIAKIWILFFFSCINFHVASVKQRA